MEKVIINEERLSQIIAEAVDEVAKEKMGVGQWLGDVAGNAYQWTRNQLANIQKGFTAGRLNQRAKNVNFNHLPKYREKYGDDYVRNMLAQRGDRYGKNRYDTMTKVWNGENPAQPDSTVRPPESYPDPSTSTQQETPTATPNGGITKQQVINTKNVVDGKWGKKGLGIEKQKVISTALGDYLQNHPELQESIIRKAVKESIEKYLK